jgi:phage terminase large subunit
MITHDFSRCPRCHSHTKKAKAFNGNESEFWYKCTKCSTYINTYIPQKHQRKFHEDSHRYKGNFGGFGSGKTLTSRQELYKHILISPNTNALIGAKVVSQYEQTIKRDIEKDIPEDFIANVSAQKSYMDLINGARIIFRPLRDPDKLRSYNLGMFVVVEASETPAEAFHQLKTRLRNMNSTIQEKDEEGNPVFEDKNGVPIPVIKNDWRKGIIESNPDSGYIRSDVLLVSDHITKHGNILDDYKVNPDAKDKNISSHITSTDANAYLPPGFIEEITKNKPNWWTARYVLSSFSYSEGLVYPAAANAIIPRKEIPKTYKRILACDYGLADDFVYLLGAVDEQNGIVYIYDEFVTNNKNMEHLAKAFNEFTDHVPTGMWVSQPIMDPKSGAKRDYDKKTLYSHFEDHGIFFKPGHVSLDARVIRTNTYLESGRLKIMSNCTYLIEQIEKYKFPEKKLGRSAKADNKPVDKDNHAINPVEWICMELPADPTKLIGGHYGPSYSLAESKKDRDAYYDNPLASPLEPKNFKKTMFDFRKGKL